MICKPRSIRELGSVDLSALMPLVDAIPEDIWNEENSRKENRFFCFSHTRHIVFRFMKGADPRNSYSKPLWETWKPHLLPIMEQVTEAYGYSVRAYPKVMLARLEAGHEIDRHRDAGPSNYLTHKIHVPLQTNSEARMYIRPDYHHLRVGQAYELNNVISHGVENHGKTDRIHLIFECFDPTAVNVPCEAA
tara:strand:+ start:41122 stop:41694 length:573 start_codon:yes stop_codon:yes gene_type:complete